MNIVVTGSLGHISEPLTKLLLQREHTVTVISSKPDKQGAIEDLGAIAAIGSLEDADFLTKTLTKADALYAMIPPNFAATDMRKYYQTIGNRYAQAIRQAGVKRVVHLSSWGADLDKGTGFILGSHDVETILNELSEVGLTHLRAGSFYYNLYGFMGMIKQAGFIGTNYGGDDLVAMVAPSDIAEAAADELTKQASGQNVRYVASDERTPKEAAQVLGAAIGKPDLQWITFTDEQARAGLKQSGMPDHLIDGIVELNASIHNGTLRQDYERHRPAVMGKVKLEDFAQEFAIVFARE